MSRADDEKILHELALMAQTYFQYGHAEKAAEIYKLVQIIRERMERQAKKTDKR